MAAVELDADAALTQIIGEGARITYHQIEREIRVCPHGWGDEPLLVVPVKHWTDPTDTVTLRIAGHTYPVTEVV